MWELTKRITLITSSVLSKVEPEPDLSTGSGSDKKVPAPTSSGSDQLRLRLRLRNTAPEDANPDTRGKTAKVKTEKIKLSSLFNIFFVVL